MHSSFSRFLQRVALLLCLFGLPSVMQATDLNMNLGLDLSATATIGLDEPTRTLIENLPLELRKQVIEALKEALPLIDERVTDYLGKVNDIIDAQINHASCAALGTAQGIAHIFGASVTFSSPTPIGDLDKLWGKTTQKYGLRATPHDVVIGYGDFLARAAVTSCEVAPAAEARETVALEQTNARWRWTVWKRVIKQCSSAEECTATVARQVHDALESADAQDLQQVAAKRRMQEFEGSPIPGPGWLTRAEDATGWDHVPLGIYEQRMSQLFRVEDDVLISRLKRGRAALKATLDTVALQQKSFDDEKPKLKQFHAGCNASEAQSDDEIIALVKKLASASTDVKQGFANASHIEPRLIPVVQSRLQSYEQSLIVFDELRQNATVQRVAMNGHIIGDDDCKAHMNNPDNISILGVETPFHNPFP